MKKIVFLGLLFLAVSAYGQVVYKTDYEVASERMGVVYSVSQQDIGEFLFKNHNKNSAKAAFRLDTYEDAKTKERVQQVHLQFGEGLNATMVNLNCSEIDDLITAVEMIEDNSELRYIAQTANFRLRGNPSPEKSLNGLILLEISAEDSIPGDLRFSLLGYVRPDIFIKMLKSVQAAATPSAAMYAFD